MTDINSLKSQITDRISAEVTTVKDVANYEKVGFTGFPAVSVSVSENENEFWSTAENMRSFVFDIDCFVQISKKVDTASDTAMQEAEKRMGNVVSDIIDAFDDDIDFGNAADFVNPAPSAWDYVELPAGYCRHAKITLRVEKIYVT